jgi:hypothetical protein
MSILLFEFCSVQQVRWLQISNAEHLQIETSKRESIVVGMHNIAVRESAPAVPVSFAL